MTFYIAQIRQFVCLLRHTLPFSGAKSPKGKARISACRGLGYTRSLYTKLHKPRDVESSGGSVSLGEGAKASL